MSELENLRRAALAGIGKLDSLRGVEEFRVRYFGRKGEVTRLLRSLGQLPPGERPAFGQKVNELRQELEEELAAAARAIRQRELAARLASEEIDVTLPGRRNRLGHHLHPITRTLYDLCDIFRGMGFVAVDGPEVESDYYNFEALNIAADHPARDMHDTFYLKPGLLLRTHTSSVQARTMERCSSVHSGLRIISAGKVYRCDYDATHTPMFHQLEGLLIDRGISLADLKGTLIEALQRIFEPSVEIRFRPSFFPFTEPSVEVDVSCVNCRRGGCSLCKGSGWLEILGAGMVHPRVLSTGGYDPGTVSGFAFGMGVERMAMIRYRINDLRLFYENDLRFISQF
ncbi:MAG: phenylalanine--tRNA ligase subunit alpha [Negativicutes bacterium]|nr:phenylalanine--tRNA ligase subunit alpha [Negativicutes bacterium]